MLYDLIRPEIEYYVRECNFTPPERKLFDLRLKGASLEEIAEEMNVSLSTAKRIHRKVKIKIARA